MSETESRRAPMAQTNEPILRATGLSKSFQMGDSDVEVLKGAALDVKAGEFLAIEGRSGSGKSTLLHILGSLESATQGKTMFGDREYTLHEPAPAHPIIEQFPRWPTLLVLAAGWGLTLLAAVMTRNHIATLDVDEISALTIQRLEWMFSGLQWMWGGLFMIWMALWLYRFWRRRHYRRRQNAAAALRRREFGFIFQFYHLLPELNVLENVMFPAMVDAGWLGYLRSRAALKQRATDVLQELGMGHRLKHKPAQLSGGERQRVAIARALMNRPKVLFADEPTGNLDAETGHQIMRVLEELHEKKGQTIVMVTHDRSVARQADRVLVMAEGRLREAR